MKAVALIPRTVREARDIMSPKQILWEGVDLQRIGAFRVLEAIRPRHCAHIALGTIGRPRVVSRTPGEIVA
jgi:hypothetical protein